MGIYWFYFTVLICSLMHHVSPSNPSFQPTLTPTSTTASLEAFEFDFSSGKITLTFSVEVRAKTFDPTKFSLQSSKISGTNTRNFSIDTIYNNMEDQGNNTMIYFYLISDDFARLQFNNLIGISSEKTYITLQFGAIESVQLTLSDDISSSDAFGVTTYVPDTSSPMLSSYIFDMNKRFLVLYFSKPIKADSFQLNGIQIQSLRNVRTQGTSVRLVNDNITINDIGDYNRFINVSLGQVNINLLTAQSGLATSFATTYLSTWSSFVTDMNGNELNHAILDETSGLEPSEMVVDTTSPVLLYFDFDITPGCLILYFSEAVKGSYFNESNVVLTNNKIKDDTSIFFRVEDASSVTIDDTNVINICINSDQIQLIRNSDNIGLTIENTYIILEYGAVVDNSDPANIYLGSDATYENAMQVSKILPDTVPPSVISFSLNMTSQTLSITFSELIDITSVLLSELTIQSKASTDFSTESITLSPIVATLLNSENDFILDIYLQNAISLANSEISTLGTSSENTYLAISRSFCKDKGGNQVLEISTDRALQCFFFYADYISPYISEWSINLNEGIISVEFSKAVNISSLLLPEITLSSTDQLVASTESLKLDTTCYIFIIQNTQVQIKLSEIIISSVKNSVTLCQYISSCYLSTSEAFGFGKTMISMTGSTVNMPILSLNNLALTTFVTDATSPKLLSFIFNMNEGSIGLTFNEPVNMQIFKSSGIKLLSLNNFGDEVTLSDDCYYDDNKSSMVVIYLSYYDLNIVKSTLICNSVESCFLEIGNFTVMDNFGNYVNSSGTFRAESIIEDTTGPSILAFSYLSSHKRLFIYLSEIIDYTRINLANFYVMSAAGSTLALSAASVVTTNSSSLLIIDMNELYTSLISKNIFTTQDSSLLFASKKDSVYDLFGNGNLKMSSEQSIRAGNRIISFRFDVSSSLITLELAMPISYLSDDVIKINEFGITDYNAESPYILTGYVSLRLSNSVFLHIELTENDLQNILIMFTISKDQLILVVGQNGIIDPVTEFGLSEVVSTITCDQLKTDHTPPSLLSFNLDLNTGVLDLFFSKTVEVTSVSIGQMRLVNCKKCMSMSNRTEIILSDATIVTTESKATMVSIQLNNVNIYPSDKDKIILSSVIGTDETSVYAIFSKGFVKDTANPPNFMDEIDDENAINVSSFSIDETPPTLLKWTLNWDSFKLTVYFDESVNATSNLPSFYTLGANPNDPDSIYYEIIYSTVCLDESIGNAVVMNIDSRDFDNIMRLSPNLCHQISSCYLSFKQGVLSDLSGNVADANYYRYGVPAVTIQQDTRSPEIVNYTLSIDEAYMEVIFDEVIDCFFFHPEYLTLQYDYFIGEVSTERFTLSSSSRVVCGEQQYQKFAIIFLDKSSVTKLKSYDFLVKSKSRTYLTIESNSVHDAFGNNIKNVLDGYAIPVTSFYKDSIAPNVAAFTMSVQGVMTLTFDEPIDPYNFAISSLILQDNYPMPSESYTLTDLISTVQNYDELKLKYRISLSTDYSRIKASGTVLNYQDRTYLRIDNAVNGVATSDTSGNILNNIPEYEAIQIGPAIINWSFDINEGIIYIYFTEEVNSNFSLNGVYLQSCKNYTDSCIEYMISTTDNVTSFNGSMSSYYSLLNYHDLNSLKYSRVAFEKSIFLRVLYGLTSSISVSTIVPYLKTVDIREYNALEIYDFIPDTTPPSITGYILDLNDGIISIMFNEPIIIELVSDITGLTFISSEGGYLNLNASTEISLTNLTYVSLKLSVSDLNRAKIVVAESLINNMIVEEGCFVDYSNNSVSEYSTDFPVLISEFIIDVKPPIVTEATLDIGTGLLTLGLNEVVIDNNLNSSHFSLFNDSRTDLMTKFNFTKYTLIESYALDTAPYILLDLYFYEIDYFKLVVNQHVGSDANNTFLGYRHITDLFGNYIDAVNFTAVSVLVDKTNPVLVAFDLIGDSSSYLLILHFSDVINITSFTCNDFILRSLNSEATGVSSVQLSDNGCASITSSSSAKISVTLSANLFSGSTIGSSQESTWIQTITNPSTKDIGGNALVNIVVSNSLRSGPRLKRYLIDMNSGIIRLVFSNDIAVSNNSFYDVRSIGFYSDISHSYYYFSNDSRIVPIFNELGQNDSIVALHLCDFDLSGLKNMDVGVNGDNLYFIINTGNAFQDESGNFIDDIMLEKKFVPYRLIVDSQRPNLLNVTYDAGLEYITLFFDEPISTGTFSPNNFRIQSRHNSIKNSYRLTGGYVTSILNSVIIQLTAIDAANIKMQNGLAKNESTSYISCIFKSAYDIAGNAFRSIKSSAAFNISNYIADTTQPELTYFSINFDSGILSLTFTEPVIVSSIDFVSLTFQSRPYSRDGVNYTLTGGIILSNDSSLISIQLLDNDIFSIKYKVGLCRNKASTYITVSNEFVFDTSGNALVPIIDGIALACGAYVGDTTPPYITSISANIDEYYIEFYFSELINLETVDVSSITVQSLGSSLTNSFTLTSGVSKVSQPYDYVYSLSARIILGSTDLNTMKYSYPLLTMYNTFISVQSAFIKDTFGNEVLYVNSDSALEVLPLTADMSRPILISYTLDMNLETIVLVFDEAMLPSSISLGQLIMQTNATRRDGNYTTMENVSFEVGHYSKSTTVQISITDIIIYMKYMNIGLTQRSSLLSWSDKFIADTTDHFISPVWDASVFGNYTPRLPDLYVPDTTSPSLVRWYIDRETYIMYLIFDEPVTLVNVSSINFFKSNSENVIVTPGYKFVITEHEYDSLGINVNLKLEDYCITYYTLKDGDIVCTTSVYTTINDQSHPSSALYISLPQSSFQDRAYAPNLINEISGDNLLVEFGPECTLCPSGYFVSKECTSHSDRICSKCSACDDELWTQTSCGEYEDTSCAKCSECSYGTYESTSCSDNSDAVCSLCSECAEDEYVASECLFGNDVVCNSCKVCDTMDSTILAKCAQGTYFSWVQENCCFDEAGEKVACNSVDLANIKLDVISGRHHWVFPITSPEISTGSGYDLSDGGF